jgi:hypothetical protein
MSSHSKAIEIVCEQYDEQWWEARKGRLTASLADKLVTPTGRPSAQWQGEIARIIAESMGLQEPKEIPSTFWMDRGSEMEAEAAAWLMVAEDIETDQCGVFINGHFGASPDRVIREEACSIPVEIKCPMPSTHIGYLIEGGLPKAYLAQVHFQIALLGAPYGIFMSYHPELEPLIVKVDADDTTELIHHQMEKYTEAYDKAVKRIRNGQE